MAGNTDTQQLHVRDLEAEGQPIIGTYVRTEEDVVVYEQLGGGIRYAPADCVQIEHDGRAEHVQRLVDGNGYSGLDVTADPELFDALWRHAEDAVAQDAGPRTPGAVGRHAAAVEALYDEVPGRVARALQALYGVEA